MRAKSFGVVHKAASRFWPERFLGFLLRERESFLARVATVHRHYRKDRCCLQWEINWINWKPSFDVRRLLNFIFPLSFSHFGLPGSAHTHTSSPYLPTVYACLVPHKNFPHRDLCALPELHEVQATEHTRQHCLAYIALLLADCKHTFQIKNFRKDARQVVSSVLLSST